jgi:cyclopropane-fatty-acyl-phospholipid synthase
MTTATFSAPYPSLSHQPGPPAPDAQPTIPAVPGGAVGLARGLAARALLRHTATRLPIRIQAPDGSISGGGGASSPVLAISNEGNSDDLPGLFTVLAENVTAIVPAPLQALRRCYIPRQPPAEDATIEGARRNIERHYDLSDDLFALFLGPTMTYSSALFAPGDTLTGAQHRKIDTLLDRTGAGPGTTMLEIGTGWGELATRAAGRGARVTTLTISPSQHAAARRRAKAAGVADRVDVQLRDYRQASGCYDVILSVEMIEAVGERYWPAYFTTIDKLLAPGGRAGLQAITMPHDRMLATRGGHTWIHQYIFPGGQIPSIQAITDTLRTCTRLRVTADYPMGAHYARTLAEWRRRFQAATSAVSQLGFSPTFQRMWNMYLAYSEAGFRAGYLDVHQLMLERGR